MLKAVNYNEGMNKTDFVINDLRIIYFLISLGKEELKPKGSPIDDHNMK